MSLDDIRAFKKVGEWRYREARGLFYEEFTPGDIIEHRPGTVTDADGLEREAGY